MTRDVAVALLALLAAAGPLAAQNALAEACTRDVQLSGALLQCATLAQTAAIALPRFSLAAAGGNPMPGDASTVGKRTPSSSRIAIGLRAGGAWLTVPAPAGPGQASLLAPSFNADVAVGVYEGLSAAPTVGGIGSVDILASVGVLSDPGHGFLTAPWTGALGARVGVLRESLTMPGVSLSVMYRRTDKLKYNLTPPQDTALLALSSIADWSFRAVVGRRFFALATSAGLGWDRAASHAAVSWPCQGSPVDCGSVNELQVTAPMSEVRPSAFAALTWTSLVWHAAGEVGWQGGGTPAPMLPATGYEGLVRRGGLFGSVTLRLTI